MKPQNNIHTTIFQDRNLNEQTPATTPLNSWQWLTAGDERAEHYESFLRIVLVGSLFIAMLICALRLKPANDLMDDSRLAAPSLHLPQLVDQAPAAAIKAASQTF